MIFILDNIDTRSVLDAIRELVSNSNIYVKDCSNPNTLLLRDIAVYITKILTIFGAISNHDAIGFPLDDESQSVNVSVLILLNTIESSTQQFDL